MLREITATRQDIRSQYRRWFSGTHMDLYVWFSKQVPTKFQLCFDKTGAEHIITWDHETGFVHGRVDDGENLIMKYKMAPIVLDDPGNTALNIFHLARDFLAASENIEPAVADFVYARLLEHPCQARSRRSG